MPGVGWTLTATQECSPWPQLGTASDQAPAEAAPAPTCLSSAHLPCRSQEGTFPIPAPRPTHRPYSPRPSHSRHRSLWQAAGLRKTRAQGPRTCPEKALSPAPAPAPAETAVLRAAGWQASPREEAVLTGARRTLTDALVLSASPLLPLAASHSPASCPVSASFTTHKALSNPLPPIYLNLSFLSCLLVLLKPARSP